MQFNSIKTASLGAFALAVLGTTAISGTAQARPVDAGGDGNGGFGRYYGSDPAGWNWNQPAVARKRKAARHERVSRRAVSQPHADNAQPSGFGGGALVSEARRYIGGNPTGRSSLWCGAFMDLILQRTGHRPGSNLARDYASYGTRVSGPQVGAIAVMSRGKRGGHVGVVSGIDEAGNPIIISGNHGRRVAETKYPRGRIYAYVMP